MTDVTKLLNGFRIFKATTFSQKKDVIHHLLEQGHKPSTMVISCADIDMAPAEIFATIPGELYVINNIGGLVPKHTASGVHGIMSAIEYAIKDLQVSNIIVLGHARCDGIKTMMSDKFTDTAKGLSESMRTWLSIAKEAREAVKKEMADKSFEEQCAACEREAVVVSFSNLMEYPYVAKLLEENKINVFGWHFDIESGEIIGINPDTGFFDSIS